MQIELWVSYLTTLDPGHVHHQSPKGGAIICTFFPLLALRLPSVLSIRLNPSRVTHVVELCNHTHSHPLASPSSLPPLSPRSLLLSNRAPSTRTSGEHFSTVDRYTCVGYLDWPWIGSEKDPSELCTLLFAQRPSSLVTLYIRIMYVLASYNHAEPKLPLSPIESKYNMQLCQV